MCPCHCYSPASCSAPLELAVAERAEEAPWLLPVRGNGGMQSMSSPRQKSSSVPRKGEDSLRTQVRTAEKVCVSRQVRGVAASERAVKKPLLSAIGDAALAMLAERTRCKGEAVQPAPPPRTELKTPSVRAV
mmetsp:Transcript_135403/g.270221  ORF Transcript_135403/g.270221 Transcript_135403/m.270221 type:complete len:132 (-) Transcript_135403:38-433(-)